MLDLERHEQRQPERVCSGNRGDRANTSQSISPSGLVSTAVGVEPSVIRQRTMMRDEVLAAARQFLELLSAPPAPEEREPALRKALDVLALAYHYPEASTEARESVSVREPGLAKHEHLCERYRTLFPDFGHYNTTWDHWENIGAGEVTIGDAIDDQADITLDVQESVDRWGQTSPEDALTSFRSSFEYHWGRHLRSLQLYLHMRAYYRFDDDE